MSLFLLSAVEFEVKFLLYTHSIFLNHIAVHVISFW